MTNEERQLLLQDLCARLPYGVKVRRQDSDEPQTLDTIYTDSGIRCQCDDDDEDYVPFENVKPYLRSREDMTVEEIREYNTFHQWSIAKEIDYLLANHFDYRRLIEKGLAIKVTKENNPYKD